MENHWSIDDLLDAHEALDINQEYKAWEIEQAKDK
jgi:hypothetical protein